MKRRKLPDDIMSQLMGSDSEKSNLPQPVEPKTDEQQLQALEQIINENLGAFYAVGCALREIKEVQLYRIQGFDNFDDYCKQRWDMGRIYAHRLEAASNVIDNLKMLPNRQQFLPLSEWQLRPLVKLEPETQRQVWEKVIEAAPAKESGTPKVTAKLIENVVAEVTGKTPKAAKETKGDKVTYKVSVAAETNDALERMFYQVRQLSGEKQQKKLSKEAMIGVLLQMALEELGEKENTIAERLLGKVD